MKGDVHDIGKNLVEIILANNGFQVVNLGIKVPPEQLVAGGARAPARTSSGLSGLLVKSAQQMVATAEDLSRAGVEVPDPGGRRGALPQLRGPQDRPRLRRAPWPTRRTR